jgi:fatty-acyl-CoA synthase
MGLASPATVEDTDATRQRLWNEPRANTLIDILTLPAALYPQVSAIRLCHHGGEPEIITWGQLWQGAGACAAWLLEAGLQSGERVLLILPTSRAFFENFFGVLLAGGVPVPAAPPTSFKESKLDAYQSLINSVALDAGAVACIGLTRTISRMKDRLRLVNPRLLMLSADAEMRASEGFEPVAPTPNETALLQYTSGSTSQPKGVELSHHNIIANTEAIGRTFITPETVGVSWLPLYHDMGLIGTLLTSLYCRTQIIFMPPQAFIKNPAVWLRTISEYQATTTVAPNFAFAYSVKNIQLEDVADVNLGCLKVALNGAEPVDLRALKDFYEKFSQLNLRAGIVRPVYGLAENSLAVTFSDAGQHVVDEVDAEQLESGGHALPAVAGVRRRSIVSVGRPIFKQEIQIADGLDRKLPERQVGEVLVRGPSVMKGYFNRPAETAEALRGGWLHTGDLGYIADGRLYLTGRSKDLIIRHGKNYYPPDIESTVTCIEGVAQGGAAAFSVEGDGDIRVVLVAETRLRDEGARAQLTRQIRERCHDTFLFGPDEIRLVPPGMIPRTTSGKVRRQECCRMFINAAFDAAGSSLER